MTLIKEANNLYQANHIVKVTTANTDFKHIAILFQNGATIKFFFENNGKLLSASSKIENALLNEENIIIDQNYLEATRTACSI